MSDSGETRIQRVRRNVIAGAVAGVFVVGAAIGVPVAVNASNTAHAQEVAQIQAAKDGTAVVRADGARDAVLAGSAVQAGVIAQQEAAAKAQAAAQAVAAAAQKAAQEAAAQAAVTQQQAQTTTTTQQTMQAATTASTGLPAGAVPPDIPGTSSPDTTKCASGTASTVNGVPTCN